MDPGFRRDAARFYEQLSSETLCFRFLKGSEDCCFFDNVLSVRHDNIYHAAC